MGMVRERVWEVFVNKLSLLLAATIWATPEI
jgi:hypothetical protein